MRGYKVVAPMNWAAGRESAKTRSAQQRRRAIRRRARQSYSGRFAGCFFGRVPRNATGDHFVDARKMVSRHEKTPPGVLPNGARRVC